MVPGRAPAAEPLFPTPVFRIAGPGAWYDVTCDLGALGDVNNDGHVDVVSTIEELRPSSTSESLTPEFDVSVLLGRGNGSFEPPLRSPVFYTPLTVSIADFNVDGAPDLAVGGLALQLSMLLGRGDGSFLPEVTLPIATGRALSVVTGDFDGDGAPDIAAGNSRSSSIDVLLGTGDGSFAPPTSTLIGPHPYSLLVDDFNLDSIPDLAAANFGLLSGQPPSVAVALGSGDGSFSAPIVHLTGAESGIRVPHFPNLIKGGDFDGDGVPDLVSRGRRSSAPIPLLLLLGRGDGSFILGPQVPMMHSTNLAGLHSSSFTPGDLDGDGALDIVAVDSDVRLATGHGDGTFDPAVPLDIAGNAQSVAIHDVNEDSHADLLVVEGQDDLLVYLNAGDGALMKPPSFPAGGPARRLVGADFNNDARPDFALLTDGPGLLQSSVSVLHGQGNRAFAPALLSPLGARAVSLATGDLNGDHRDDLLVGIPGSSRDDDTGGVRILLSLESGFSPSFLTVASSTYPLELVTLDANLDGAVDLLVLNSILGELSTHLGRGDGTFLDGARIALGPEVESLAVARLDADAFPDLALADRGARMISILSGDGQGGFRPLPPVRLESTPLAVALGRFDGDPFTDLLVSTLDDGFSDSSRSGITVYLGDGDGSFRFHSEMVVSGLNTRLPKIADFNADGLSDVAYPTGSGHAIHLGRGDGTFPPEIRFHTAGTLGPSLAMDLDSDRRVDLASASLSKDRLTVLYNQGPFPILTVGIDIVPGSRSNPVNPASGGVTPVAVLSAQGFAAPEVIPGSIRLAGAPVRTDPRQGRPHCQIQDVNGDGLSDLLCHILSAEMNLTLDSLEAVLEAELLTGGRIRGQDDVRVVGPTE